MLLAIAAASAPAATLPEWMVGCWETRSGDRWTEECWSTPRGSMMLGYSRSGVGERLTEFEQLRMVIHYQDGQRRGLLRYMAAPGGGNSTTFEWTPKPQWPGITVYNITNDYPQRIRYWRDGDQLIAEIALSDGSKAQRWRYSRTR